MKTGGGLPPGLAALAKERPDVVKNMGYDVAMDGTRLSEISKKLGIKPETAKKLATIGMKAMKNGGVLGGAPVLSAGDGARMYLFGGKKSDLEGVGAIPPPMPAANAYAGANPPQPVDTALDPVETAIDPMSPMPVAGDGDRVYKFGGKYAQKGTVNNGDDKNGDDKNGEEDPDFYELTLYKKLKNEVLPQQLQNVYSTRNRPHETGPAIDYDSESRTYKIPKKGTREESIAAFMKEHPDVRGYEDFSEAYSDENLNDSWYMKRVRHTWNTGKQRNRESFYIPFKMHNVTDPGKGGVSNDNWDGLKFMEGNLPEFKEEEKETPEPVKKEDPKPVRGCTNPKALNYNPKATEDDGSCELPPPPKKEDPVPPRPELEPSGFNFTQDPIQQDATAVRYQGGNPDFEKLINAIELQRMYGGKTKMKPLKKYGGYMK